MQVGVLYLQKLFSDRFHCKVYPEWMFQRLLNVRVSNTFPETQFLTAFSTLTSTAPWTNSTRPIWFQKIFACFEQRFNIYEALEFTIFGLTILYLHPNAMWDIKHTFDLCPQFLTQSSYCPCDFWDEQGPRIIMLLYYFVSALGSWQRSL